MNKAELLKIAHEKISNMSIKQLEMFCGIFTIKLPVILPLSDYKTTEIVEISTLIPAIGYEFIGTKAKIIALSEHKALLELPETEEFVKLTPDRIRKIS